MARSVIDLPAPDGPRMAIRLLADWWASRSRKVPTVRSRSKETATGSTGGGAAGGGSASGRAQPARPAGSRLMSSTTTATPSASAVGAWVSGMPVEENCT